VKEPGLRDDLLFSPMRLLTNPVRRLQFLHPVPGLDGTTRPQKVKPTFPCMDVDQFRERVYTAAEEKTAPAVAGHFQGDSDHLGVGRHCDAAKQQLEATGIVADELLKVVQDGSEGVQIRGDESQALQKPAWCQVYLQLAVQLSAHDLGGTAGAQSSRTEYSRITYFGCAFLMGF